MNPRRRASFLNASMIAIAGAVLVMGAPTIAGAAGVTAEVAHEAPIGDYPGDSHGRTPHLFEKDEGRQSNCYRKRRPRFREWSLRARSTSRHALR